MRLPIEMEDEVHTWVEKNRLEIAFEDRRVEMPGGVYAGLPPRILSATYRGVTVSVNTHEIPIRSELRAREWMLFQLAAPFLLTEE